MSWQDEALQRRKNAELELKKKAELEELGRKKLREYYLRFDEINKQNPAQLQINLSDSNKPLQLRGGESYGSTMMFAYDDRFGKVIGYRTTTDSDWNTDVYYYEVDTPKAMDTLLRNVHSNKRIWDDLKSINPPGTFCFIATAVYGPFSPEVIQLRNFRDERLLRTPLGRTVVVVYYFLSPSIARLIDDNRIIKAIAKKLLTPVLMTTRKYLR